VNEAGCLLENLNFQWCALNANKINIVVYFSELVRQFLSTWFSVHMSKISAKSDNFLLNYSKLFGSPLFIQTQCTTLFMATTVKITNLYVVKLCTSNLRYHELGLPGFSMKIRGGSCGT